MDSRNVVTSDFRNVEILAQQLPFKDLATPHAAARRLVHLLGTENTVERQIGCPHATAAAQWL